ICIACIVVLLEDTKDTFFGFWLVLDDPIKHESSIQMEDFSTALG
nr:hypothetical protein [Tanacetum cinerariifolium]